MNFFKFLDAAVWTNYIGVVIIFVTTEFCKNYRRPDYRYRLCAEQESVLTAKLQLLVL